MVAGSVVVVATGGGRASHGLNRRASYRYCRVRRKGISRYGEEKGGEGDCQLGAEHEDHSVQVEDDVDLDGHAGQFEEDAEAISYQ